MSNLKTKTEDKESLKFIDLFCGIGGFHQALIDLGHTCKLACDIDKNCRDVYNENFNMVPYNDVKDIVGETFDSDINIICAGFPCQPFSNGGNKGSFKDKRGNLFEEILRIKKKKKPEFMFLENVKHIKKIDNGNAFKTILKKIREHGYKVSVVELSPHQLGVPQQRERVIFSCIRSDIYSKKFSQNENFTEIKGDKERDYKLDLGLEENKSIDFNNFFEKNTESKYGDKYKINDELKKVIEAWDEFVSFVDVGQRLSPTILCHNFKTQIFKLNDNGEPILDDDDKPIYTSEFSSFPTWKKEYIIKNRPLYEKYRSKIDTWYEKHKDLLMKKEIYSKLEWQVGPKENQNTSIFDYFIQIRQSGLRIKRCKYFPTLVAIVQTPIYGKEKRYITPRECARLQSFPDNFKLHENKQVSYKQFGNAVNVEVVKHVMKLILDNYKN